MIAGAPAPAARDVLQHTKLDAIDLQIIQLLRRDGRMTNRAIAQQLKITEPTARSRIRRLSDRGIVRVTAVTNIEAFGYTLFVLLWIQVEGRSIKDVGTELAAIPTVSSVTIRTGTYDLFVTMVAKDMEQLFSVITGRIITTHGVRAVFSALALKVVVHKAEWGSLSQTRYLTPNDVRVFGADQVVSSKSGLDTFDYRLIEELSSDARTSNREIARRLGISESMARKRINVLKARNIIKISAITDTISMNMTVTAYIGIHVDGIALLSVVDALKAVDEIQFIAVTLGIYDIVAIALVDSRDRLLELLANKIGAIPGVRRTETDEGLEVIKHTVSLAKLA